MKFGVLTLPNLAWPELTESWLALDGLSRLDSLWVADHLANPYRRQQRWFDGWTCLAAMALQTSTVRIGPLVANPILRGPAMLAKGAAAVAHMLFLYLNFSGYMDVVVGVGKLFGQELPENFNAPLLARNFLEATP